MRRRNIRSIAAICTRLCWTPSWRVPASTASCEGDWPAALRAYEHERLAATSRIVLTNRVAPPDVVLKEVYERTGDRPFDDIEKVISRAELAELQNAYKRIAGYDLEILRRRAAQTP